MPNDFSSSKKRLTLENNATLGEELMIVFNEDEIKKEREKLMNESGK